MANNKQTSLAVCLFEAIDDQNLSNLIVLLEKHGADPNIIIPKLQIAPIHYAVGFDNLEFAETVTEIFLKKKADPNLLSESDGLRPLHIACMWGREKIVKLLLDNGADLDLRCSENQTPINYAIHENNFNVIETIQKFVFEKKIEKKRKDLILKSKDLEELKSGETFSTPIRNNHLKNAIQTLEEKKFTPNRINYNFDVTSPYYIGITHRRHKTSRENSRVVDEDEPETSSKKNLFELTQKNLREFSEQMSQVIVIDRLAIHKRRSYIKDWREKIQHIRKNDTKLDIDYINYLNSCNDVTLMKKSPDSSVVEEIVSSSDSFTTAKSDLQRSENAIRPVPDYTEVIQENFIHSDVESGVVLFERRIVSKSRENLQDIEECEDARSRSSVSTKVTMPPLDYDTDALRTELKSFGENPGPITKNTKKLYLKQLVKIRKRPEVTKDRKNVQVAFPHELQKSIANFSFLEQNLTEFIKLEAEMSRHFTERPHIKWREGNIKTSFIYLLLDPRISESLPENYKDMDKREVWSRFLSSIFYVGKGKKSRPYSHLYDAIKLFSMENNQIAERMENRKNQIIEKRVIYSNAANKVEAMKEKCKVTKPVNSQESKKLQKILEIWRSKLGVVCLHTFNNIMPVEAFTREAAIIDAMGISTLTNVKKGDYYGVARSFSSRQKRQMGVGLLYRAMNVYLHEGESQLTPFDLI